tara:strand:- start:1450 stop:1986 length:537 start_codon:yes stop_codon:yes gene_type:complete
MLIDKTFSKKDLLKIFAGLGYEFNKNKSKASIVSEIETIYDKLQYNETIQNLTQLKDILKSPNTKQKPNLEEKSVIMFKCKSIVRWASNNYALGDIYENETQAYNDIMYVYKWGDIPSVRRACNFYNLSPVSVSHINPVISSDVQQEINQKKILKKQYKTKLTVKYATKENPIFVYFD